MLIVVYTHLSDIYYSCAYIHQHQQQNITTLQDVDHNIIELAAIVIVLATSDLIS